MVRPPRFEKMGLRKGKWTVEEDQKLISYIKRYGIWNWNEMPKPAGLLRSGKSCRLRWMNYLRPDIKRGNFTKEEEEIILEMHEKLGNKWSEIAARLPGRTDNEIKNQWNTRYRKQFSNVYPSPGAVSQHEVDREIANSDPKIKLDNNLPSSISKDASKPFFSVKEALIHDSAIGIAVPPLSPMSNSSSSNNIEYPAVVVDEQIQTTDLSTGSAHTFFELPSFWEHPFFVEDFHMNDVQATYVDPDYMDPISQVWYQEPLSLSGCSYGVDVCDDFWINLLVQAGTADYVEDPIVYF